MNHLEKYQTPILFAAIPLGLLLGQISAIEHSAEAFVAPFLFVMLLGSFLNIPLGEYRKAFANLPFSITTVLINFVWTPVLVWLLGKLLLSHSPLLQIGFIMLMVTPCTDWYLVFTGMAGGNVPLSGAVLPVNLVLQVVLLPVYLLLFGGISGTVNLSDVLGSVATMLLLPFALAQAGKWLLTRFASQTKRTTILGFMGSAQTLLLAAAIGAMFAAKGQSLLGNLNIVWVLLLPILLFYAVNFVLAQLVSKKLGYSYADTASLTLTTIAKNSPMTLGVALLAFPNEPLIHLIMVIEPLIELPAMLLITKMLLVVKRRRS